MPQENDLRLDLARALAAEVAPEELPFFEELVKGGRAGATTRKDSELGFGGEAALVGVASVFLYQISETILAFIWEQAQALLGDVAKSAAKDLRKEIEAKVGKWIKNRFRGSPPIEIPADKRQALIRTISKDAKHAGIGEVEIKRLTTVLNEALVVKASG